MCYVASPGIHERSWLMTIQTGSSARTPVSVVRDALATDLSPNDIASLGSKGEFVLEKLRAAYEEAPIDRLPPRVSGYTRPYWSYGRESHAEFAPAHRTTVALEALIYHHQVVIEDPVEWFVFEGCVSNEDTLQLLHCVAQLAPLMDEGLVLCVADRSSRREPELSDDFVEALTRKAYDLGDEAPTGPDIDITYDVLGQIFTRNALHGRIDILTKQGAHLYRFLRDATDQVLSREWATTMAHREVSILVPNVERVLTEDLIRIRESDQFGEWQRMLREAMRAYSLEAERQTADALDAFRDCLSGPAADLQAAVQESSVLTAARRGSRNILFGLVGAAAVRPLVWELFRSRSLLQ